MRAAAARNQRVPNNYPPSDTALCALKPAQMYRRDRWEYGLTNNSALLGTQVALSGVQPDGLAGLGLFANRRFEEGQVVGYLWGKFLREDQWVALTTRYVDTTVFDPNDEQEEDYVSPVQQGIHRGLSVPLQEDGASYLVASQQCPAAYINQGHAEETCNVKFNVPTHAFDCSTPVDRAYRYLEVVVHTANGRGVDALDEFTVDYGWKPEVFAELKLRYADYLAQLEKTRMCQLRGKFERMRAQRAEAGDSSVVTASPTAPGSGSSATSDKNATAKRRRQLEQEIQQDTDTMPYELQSESADLQAYRCCAKLQCHQRVTKKWITESRSVYTHTSHAHWAGPKNVLPSPVADLWWLPLRTRNAWAKMNSDERARYATNMGCRFKLQGQAYARSVYAVQFKGAQIVVCHQFWTDVFQGHNAFLQRQLEMAVQRVREDPKADSVRRWFEAQELLHEFQPDAVGAGRGSKLRTGVMIPHARKKDVYAHYLEDQRKDPLVQHSKGSLAGDSHFYQIWKDEYHHVKLRKTTRFAKCDDCVRLRELIRAPVQGDHRRKVRGHAPARGMRKPGLQRGPVGIPAREEFRLHLDEMKRERHYYHNKRREAREKPWEVLSMIVDGADQGSYGEHPAGTTARTMQLR